MNTPLIIEAAEANDTLVFTLGKPSKALHATYYATLGVLIAGLAWGYFSVVDISVHAEGVVRPLGGVYPVQSTMTAGLREIRVRENSFVQKGDTLAVLDVPASEEQMQLVRERIYRFKQELSDVRALAELSLNHRFSFPTFARERDVALAEKAVREKDLAAKQAKLRRTSDLFAKNFASAEEHETARLQVEQQTQALEQWQQSHLRSALEREKQITTNLAEEESTLKKLALEHRRTVLCAPESGFVTNLSVRSANVVLNSSQTLCTIAPPDEQCVEFVIPARDVGFVREGLQVRYQIDALPFQEWGVAQGTVRLVAKDMMLGSGQMQDSRQQAVFKIIGSLPQEPLHSKRQGQSAKVIAGMTCRASVVIAQKRLLTMLWDKTTRYFALQ